MKKFSMSTVIALVFLTSAALATPGDVYDPETDSWGQPDKEPPTKPEPEKPTKPKVKDDNDHTGAIVTGYYCMGFRDGRKEVWKIGEPGYAFDPTVGIHWCHWLQHPDGTVLWDWQAEAEAEGVK